MWMAGEGAHPQPAVLGGDLCPCPRPPAAVPCWLWGRHPRENAAVTGWLGRQPSGWGKEQLLIVKCVTPPPRLQHFPPRVHRPGPSFLAFCSVQPLRTLTPRQYCWNLRGTLSLPLLTLTPLPDGRLLPGGQSARRPLLRHLVEPEVP